MWKWDEPADSKSWVKQVVIPPIPGHSKIIEQASAYPPLLLFVKANHYTTLHPSSGPFPMQWHESPLPPLGTQETTVAGRSPTRVGCLQAMLPV
jgi:hypothetical protein